MPEEEREVPSVVSIRQGLSGPALTAEPLRRMISLPAPQITPRLAGDVLELAVRLGAEQLPPGELCVGLTAVVESADGRHSYWSLRHPAGQPDFHHREGLALALRVPTP